MNNYHVTRVTTNYQILSVDMCYTSGQKCRLLKVTNSLSPLHLNVYSCNFCRSQVTFSRYGLLPFLQYSTRLICVQMQSFLYNSFHLFFMCMAEVRTVDGQETASFFQHDLQQSIVLARATTDSPTMLLFIKICVFSFKFFYTEVLSIQ